MALKPKITSKGNNPYMVLVFVIRNEYLVTGVKNHVPSVAVVSLRSGPEELLFSVTHLHINQHGRRARTGIISIFLTGRSTRNVPPFLACQGSSTHIQREAKSRPY